MADSVALSLIDSAMEKPIPSIEGIMTSRNHSATEITVQPVPEPLPVMGTLTAGSLEAEAISRLTWSWNWLVEMVEVPKCRGDELIGFTPCSLAFSYLCALEQL